MNVDNGLVLHQQDALRSWYPASLTKMMTLYLTFMALQDNELSLDEKLKVSVRAAAQSGSHLGLTKGETISVNDAIMAVATISANDAAVLLAERLAENEDKFARQMTAQARKLGMSGSVFRNASGLSDHSQTTTARDMVLLGSRLFFNFPNYFHYFSHRTTTFKGRRRNATNGLIGKYAGVDGIKTGFTCDSGYNMVASAERHGTRLIVVALGSKSISVRNSRMKRLLDRGFDQAAVETTGVPLNMLDSKPTDDRLPPVRLSPAECSALSVLTSTPLPGWGILLGIHTDRKQASSTAWKAHSKLKGVVNSSRPAILQRKFGNRSSWKVLLVGLSKKNVGKACKHLRSSGLNCVAQSPQAMNGNGFAHR